jgi:hypothetical protein
LQDLTHNTFHQLFTYSSMSCLRYPTKPSFGISALKVLSKCKKNELHDKYVTNNNFYAELMYKRKILYLGQPMITKTNKKTNQKRTWFVPIFFFIHAYDQLLVWCPGQNKRIAPLSFRHGCRKRRLKD